MKEPRYVKAANIILLFHLLINKFNVVREIVDQFLKVWAAVAKIMKQQPGFISTQLHSGIVDNSIFINYAIWKSTTHFKQAFNNPDSLQSLDLFHLGIVIACIATLEFSQLFRDIAHYLNYCYSQR